MDGKYFLKQESIIFKIIYVVGIIAFLKHLNDLTIGNNQLSLILPIIAFGSFILFFIRLIISEKKDNENENENEN
jgi:hypothetical protein